MHYQDDQLTAYLDRYANWNGLKSIAITFDVDWAPDYMIAEVLDQIERNGLKATFFATHDSAVLRKIAADGVHEVGLHPNLLPNSTQGATLKEAVENLRQAYPNAAGNRFHVLRMSYRDLMWMGRNGFKYDVSRLLYNAPYLVPAWQNDVNMVLFPYAWEDGICENQGEPPHLDCIALDSPGLKIFNFHPMNAYINCASREDRLAFQDANPDLLNSAEEDASKFRREGQGAGQALADLCRALKERNVSAVTVGEMAAAYPRELHGAE